MGRNRQKWFLWGNHAWNVGTMAIQKCSESLTPPICTPNQPWSHGSKHVDGLLVHWPFSPSPALQRTSSLRHPQHCRAVSVCLCVLILYIYKYPSVYWLLYLCRKRGKDCNRRKLLKFLGHWSQLNIQKLLQEKSQM